MLMYCCFLVLIGSMLEYVSFSRFITAGTIFLAGMLRVWAFIFQEVENGDTGCFTYPNIF